MRRLTIFVLLAALVGLTAACGDDDSSSGSSGDDTEVTEPAASGDDSGSGDVDDSELDEFVQGFLSSSDGIVSEADARCVGSELLPELSDEGKSMLNSDTGDIEDLTSADQDAMYASFDECISVDVIAESIAAGMTAGTDATSDETAQCVADKISSSYEKSGDLMKELLDAESDQSAFTALIMECVVPAGG